MGKELLACIFVQHSAAERPSSDFKRGRGPEDGLHESKSLHAVLVKVGKGLPR
jgi:hypothetical protein